ncbi:MAG TPA: cupin domain-containing protein [Chloroflexota bacterium]|nr:cupin domain-containing protein [Chloroflexota bacterium]
MRGSSKDLPVAFDGGEVVIRQADWSDLTVSIENFPRGLETAPIFKGLPDDRCQCPHWGYVVKGRMRILYRDREETLSAGDAYYVPAGHTAVFEEPTQLVEFSPRGEYAKTMEVAARNAAAMGRG